MRRMLFVCSFLAAALMAGPALAAPSTDGDKCVKQKNGVLKCEYGGDDVWGAVVGPKGRFIGGKNPVVFSLLIEYRANFLPEMDKTVEAL